MKSIPGDPVAYFLFREHEEKDSMYHFLHGCESLPDLLRMREAPQDHQGRRHIPAPQVGREEDGALPRIRNAPFEQDPERVVLLPFSHG
jgi:hypothetical protein